VIGRNEGLKLAVKSLVYSVPTMIHLILITSMFFAILSIINVSFLKGKLYYCLNPLLENSAVTKWDCLDLGGHWKNHDQNYDNFGRAMMAIFQMVCIGNWSQLMYQVMAAVDIDIVPVSKSNIYISLYFITFNAVMLFFVINIFSGIVISTFNRERDRINGNYLLTEMQKEYIQSKLMVLRSKPIIKYEPPSNGIRFFMLKIAKSKWFERIIFVCIILNMLIIMTKFYMNPTLLDTVSDNINLVFTAIFTIEAIIKIIALGGEYFKDGWNIFDLIIVVASLASVFVSAFTAFNLGGKTIIIRAMRVLRILRLVKRAKHLYLVFSTLVHTLPAMTNIGGLLCLLVYLYSIIGIQLFS
jgi:hypothetical protein